MNEINYKVFFNKEDKSGLSEDEIEFMESSDKYENPDAIICDKELVRCLFFNLLFNIIEYDKVTAFLDFHFDNCQQDKRDFLRVLKLDIDEIFELFEIPWRDRKLISTNAFGTTRYDIRKLIIKDIIPFFEPYDYIKYVNYKRRYKDAKYWIKNKMNEIKLDFQNIKTKNDKYSITRARAFCFKLMHDNEKINFYDIDKKFFMKTEMIQYIESLWKGQSGQTVYEDFLKINAKYDFCKTKYKKEYNYGLELFNELRL